MRCPGQDYCIGNWLGKVMKFDLTFEEHVSPTLLQLCTKDSTQKLFVYFQCSKQLLYPKVISKRRHLQFKISVEISGASVPVDPWGTSLPSCDAGWHVMPAYLWTELLIDSISSHFLLKSRPLLCSITSFYENALNTPERMVKMFIVRDFCSQRYNNWMTLYYCLI